MPDITESADVVDAVLSAAVDSAEPSTQETAPCEVMPVTFSQRVRSYYHGIWHGLTASLRWTRGACVERPAGRLVGQSAEAAAMIADLQQRYGVTFEQQLNATTALNCYDYAAILDAALRAWNVTIPAGGALHDIGSANFWYATVLDRLFRPSSLVGVEVDGYRLYPNGYSRWDAAQGYLSAIPQGRYVVADYQAFCEPADLITAWYPFVTAEPLLAWRLPLTVFHPSALFARVAQNLRDGGLFFMVNHGHEEAAVASAFCLAAGLRPYRPSCAPHTLRSHSRPPVVSCWRRPAV